VDHGNPKLDHGNQRSHERGPEANQEKYAGAGANNLWNLRWGIGRSGKLDDSEAKQQNGR
jgi:hypothetical protein